MGITDHQLASQLAAEAGELLLEVRAEYARASRNERKDAGDQRAQGFLAAALARARPNDAILSEEAHDDLARLTADRVWIIDPLDGTREFGEPDRVDWAVHVALWERDESGAGGELVAGAVALPAQDLTLWTPDVPRDSTPTAGKLRIVVSRTRPPAVAHAVRDALGGVLVGLGSAGAKVMAVVRGQAEVYLHTGGQYEWDSAAPVAVARAAGLHTSRVDGSALLYNQRDSYLPDLLVCRPELADQVLAVSRRVAW